MPLSAVAATAVADMERQFERACRNREIPGAVVVATNRDGSFYYEKAFGKANLADADQDESEKEEEKDMNTQTVLLMASCTKLLTSICALQCVQRGLVTFDQDLASIVPELDALPVLLKVDLEEDATEKIVTRKREGAITLRHLLTHTSGLGYDFLTPKLMKYRTIVKLPRPAPGEDSISLVDRYSSPLVYDPGTSWGYSCALDWAGKVVERVSGLDLQTYMQRNIFDRLGIRDLTFFLDQRPDMAARKAGMHIRDGDLAVPFRSNALNFGNKDAQGGGGIFGTMPEYVKVLQSLLRDDGVLLSHDMYKEMFRPQLDENAHAFLNGLRDRPEVWSMFPGEFPRHIRLDWGLGGMLMLDRDEGWRGKGTMVWSGLPNLVWFLDRENDLCGIYGGQVLPPGDAKSVEMVTLFEKTMYKIATGGPRL